MKNCFRPNPEESTPSFEYKKYEFELFRPKEALIELQ